MSKKNRKYPLLDLEGLKQSVRFWNSPGQTHRGTFTGMTFMQAIKHIHSEAKKTPELNATLCAYQANPDLMVGNESRELVDFLINHPQRHRFRLINDGSYYNNRVWFHYVHDRVEAEVNCQWIEALKAEMDRLPPQKQVDFLLKHFELVYIQTDIAKNREDILCNIREERRWRTMIH